MGEIEPAYARAGPHRKRFSNQHAGVRLHIEQTPDCALLRMVWARRIPRGGSDPSIFLVDEVRVAQAFLAAVSPLIPRSLVQAFGKRFRQAIGYRLRHDCVVVVVLGSEPVAQLFQATAAGHRESTDSIGQSRFLRRDKVGELSLIHISEPTRQAEISYAVFCLKK